MSTTISTTLFLFNLSLMCVVAVCSLSCVSFEQFAVAKSGIEKRNDGGDAEARAQLDEAVVLEVDEVRDSTAAPPRFPLTFTRMCVFCSTNGRCCTG